MALKNAQLAFDHSLRLPDGEFFPAARKKTGIALHHTEGGTAASTIHQVFEPTAWAFQFGLKWPPARRMKFEQRFIGIEIASEGGLTEFDTRL
jgi:hypothetical protein